MTSRRTPGPFPEDRVARATALIRALAGVVDVAVKADASGIRTIAVVAEPELSAWEVGRNIQSALLASLGLTIDPAIVEVRPPAAGSTPDATPAAARPGAVARPAGPVTAQSRNGAGRQANGRAGNGKLSATPHGRASAGESRADGLVTGNGKGSNAPKAGTSASNGSGRPATNGRVAGSREEEGPARDGRDAASSGRGSRKPDGSGAHVSGIGRAEPNGSAGPNGNAGAQSNGGGLDGGRAGEASPGDFVAGDGAATGPGQARPNGREWGRNGAAASRNDRPPANDRNAAPPRALDPARGNGSSAAGEPRNGRANGKARWADHSQPVFDAPGALAPPTSSGSHPTASLARLELESRPAGRVGCSVLLAMSDHTAAGQSDGVDTPAGRLDAAARAVVAASSPAAAVDLDGVRLVELAGRKYVIAAVRSWSGPETLYRAEVAPVDASPEAAAAQATLGAILSML